MSPENLSPLTPDEQKRSWFAALLLRGDSPILSRFVAHYTRLSQQPRRWRRRFTRGLAVTMTGAAMLLAVAGFGARAEGDNVITVVNGEVKIANNGKCSLVEAIRNANNQNNGQPHDDCAAGNPTGADTIVLPVNGVFTLTEANNDSDYGSNGLPWIGSAMTIEGNGSTIQRKDNAPEFRILAIGPKGNLILNSVTISGGYSGGTGYGGAGIFNQGEVTIYDSTIYDNVAEYLELSGGGILNDGYLTIVNSEVINNRAYARWNADGGGIVNSGSLILKNSIVTENAVISQSGFGGGIVNSGILHVEDSLISNNSANGSYISNGGGIDNFGTAMIIRSTISNNIATGDAYESYLGFGGGIRNVGTLTLANVSITGNEIEYGYGGGISNHGEAVIINSTLSENVGDGIFAGCGIGSSVSNSLTNLLRTIVSGNFQSEISANPYSRYGEYCTPVFVGNAHNIIGANGNANSIGFTPGPTDIIPSVPLNAIIGPLADNGGPTWTHALPPGSPAIDRAPNNACTAAPVNGVDQRGFPRNRNGAGGASTTECDIGAFEFQPVEPTPTPTATALPTSTPTATATTPGEATQTPPPLPSATATIDPYPVATATAQATPEFNWESFIPILIQAPAPIR